MAFHDYGYDINMASLVNFLKELAKRTILTLDTGLNTHLAGLKTEAKDYETIRTGVKKLKLKKEKFAERNFSGFTVFNSFC